MLTDKVLSTSAPLSKRYCTTAKLPIFAAAASAVENVGLRKMSSGELYATK
jgi:hypothetical protein